MMHARWVPQGYKYLYFRVCSIKLGALVYVPLEAFANIVESQQSSNEIAAWCRAHSSSTVQDGEELEDHIFAQLVRRNRKRPFERVEDLIFVVFSTHHRVSEKAVSEMWNAQVLRRAQYFNEGSLLIPLGVDAGAAQVGPII